MGEGTGAISAGAPAKSGATSDAGGVEDGPGACEAEGKVLEHELSAVGGLLPWEGGADPLRPEGAIPYTSVVEATADNLLITLVNVRKFSIEVER